MKAVIQRVKEASVRIEYKNYNEKIGKGLLILLGIKDDDTIEDVNFVADKCSQLRVFEDRNDKMNISVQDIEGEVMIVSQFTLYGETSKGNRPSFIEAAKPDKAIPLYELFVERMKNNVGEEKVKCGLFGEMMDITLVNYGPVTVTVESKK
jgi:D-tyrosyl-tRNA(Tyr) deacylase